MEETVKDLSTPALLTAIEANLFAFFRLLRRWPKAEVHEEPTLLWSLSSVPFPLFNSILRAQLDSENVETAITAAIARGRARHVPLLWWTGPATRPADLGRYLTAHGFSGEEFPGMAADLRTLPDTVPVPSGLVIERVVDVDSLKSWAALVCATFEFPPVVAEDLADCLLSLGLAGQTPFRHYLARLEGEPVGTSSVLLGAGVAGIYNVGTVPAVRRQGVGTALTVIPLLQARAMGHRIAILHSSAMAVSAYRHLGFDEYCTIGQYVWAVEQDVADAG
jgi:GNAT superfamily N-acetyltransferase